jgi:hypothetical protein
MLADEIAKINRAEAIAALDAGEAAIAAEVAKAIGPAQVELTDRVRIRLAEFAKWAADHSIRACAAKPTTVAAWVLDHRHLGADAIMDMLAAIETLHNHHGLSLPTKSAIVCRALEEVFKAEPPRSWRQDEKLLFAALPQDIQQIIARRERDRERELRRAQNLAAELQKQLNPDAAKPVEHKQKASIQT